jgi:membrane-bound inhibitor of C-type lysozyme
MRALLSTLALFCAVCTPAAISSADAAQHSYGFRCPQDLLRVVFDDDRHVALIYRFGKPTIILAQQTASGDGFHYSNARYDLEGTYEQAHFRVGQGRAETCRRVSVNG